MGDYEYLSWLGLQHNKLTLPCTSECTYYFWALLTWNTSNLLGTSLSWINPIWPEQKLLELPVSAALKKSFSQVFLHTVLKIADLKGISFLSVLLRMLRHIYRPFGRADLNVTRTVSWGPTAEWLELASSERLHGCEWMEFTSWSICL